MYIKRSSNIYFTFKEHIREGSEVWKHLENTHGGLKDGERFADYIDVEIVKAYTKPITRVTTF